MGATLGSSRNRRSRWKTFLVLAVLGAVGFGFWGGLRHGPAPLLSLETRYPAVGGTNDITAGFSEPELGLGNIRIEVAQGERVEEVARREFTRPGPFRLTADDITTEATLETTIGSANLPWLTDGEVTIRVVADRLTGPLRAHDVVTLERKLPVRLRPPRLEVLDGRASVRQGGTSVAVLRVGENAIRSGVRAGQYESKSHPMPEAPPDRRLVLYAVPWDLDGDLEIRAFAEDDAGNRAEVPFVTSLRRVDPRRDTIEISDRFLERVVPAISSRTPGFDTSGSLLEQYLRINGEYRRNSLEIIRLLTDRSADRFLWSEPFLQLPRSARKAGFAETRSYTYHGRTVDQQTHLGLDLASTRNAPVPSAADGRVMYAGWLAIYGNVVVIDHGCGLMTAYGHLDAIDVADGDTVARGQHIGITGTTGLAGGDHLHFEVFVGGYSVNPMEWLDERWIRNNLASRVPVEGM